MLGQELDRVAQVLLGLGELIHLEVGAPAELMERAVLRRLDDRFGEQVARVAVASRREQTPARERRFAIRSDEVSIICDLRQLR